MIKIVTRIFTIIIIAITIASCSSKKIDTLSNTTDFNFDWEFKLDNTSPKNNDWKKITLPHDWSREFSFDSINGEGATGYLPGGIGYYKKDFSLNLLENKKAYILFDGVYNNATFSINNKELGFHPYGYSPFFYDITPHLNKEKNTINVKVDRTRYADSRWYTGSGIYRNVKLVIKDKLHIPIWGTFITTPNVSKENATVLVETKLKNEYKKDKTIKLRTEIFNNSNALIASSITDITVAKGEEKVIKNEILIKNPDLWDIKNPNLYKAITSIVVGTTKIDSDETTFGVRKIKFDKDTGFFLNDTNMKIKGVCLHHDGGLVGAAVPKGVWKRRLTKLREAGCNAIRISHNPASQEFLDLCDEMGFLVQDEFFDEWDNPKDKRLNKWETKVDSITQGYVRYFQNWAERDLKNSMLAHRNHPSIIQWSIGNEIEWTYSRNADATGFFDNMDWQGNYFWSPPPFSPEKIKNQLETLPRGKYDIGKTAQKLANWTRELDTTRYIVANCILPSASHLSGYADALDIVGYSYRRVLYDYGHENYPDKPIMGTENLPQWHEWKAIMERPHISGTFLWTGIDYLGESNGHWPKKGTNSGLLDLAGFERGSYHMYKTLWNNDPHVHITTQNIEKSIYKIDKATGEVVEKKKGNWKHALWVWQNVNEHWNYNDEEKIAIEVYSNCDEVELFLNEKSLGTKKLKDFEDHIYKWVVPFKEGKLTAKGKKDGKIIETKVVTTNKPNSIKLTVDKKILSADGYDVSHIVAQLIDDNGNPVKTENRTINFESKGEIKILGVDNGAITNVQDFNSNTIKTDNGRCLLIVQSIKNIPGEVTITANSTNLKSESISISIK
ncbi:glycoside hydrolase family 2 TIM barrel-domain containing protein [uncultured Maribacter sp.]|uniref:glycoside hydrolase family 2 TIM barrel-domain containing protein n=1 Tax=uncultured Maribacter sp. TaxID=431308 RepID=UPI0026104F38|nr:glycoside hydrolase family 2 TIM barrel-domain containing protein [uncultured Maribacter sp.]